MKKFFRSIIREMRAASDAEVANTGAGSMNPENDPSHHDVKRWMTSKHEAENGQNNSIEHKAFEASRPKGVTVADSINFMANQAVNDCLNDF